MAVAQPCQEKDLEQWKREMEENRRKRWRSWLRCWTEAEVSESEGELEEDWSQSEGQRPALDKEELSKIKEKSGGGEAKERKIMRKCEETRMSRGESNVGKESDEEVEGICVMSQEDDGGVVQGIDEVKWNERKVIGCKREDEKNEQTIQELMVSEQSREEEGATGEIRGNEDLDGNRVEAEGDEGKFEVDNMEVKCSRGKEEDEDSSLEMERDHILNKQDNKGLNTTVEEMRTDVIKRREVSDDRGGDLEISGNIGEVEAKDVEDIKGGPEEKCDYDDEVDDDMVDDDDKEYEKEVMVEVEEKNEEEEVKMTHNMRKQVSGTRTQQSQDLKPQNNPTFSAESHSQGPDESEEDSRQSDFEDEYRSNMEELSTFQKESRCSGRDEEEVQSDKTAAGTLQGDDSSLQEEEGDADEESTDEEECVADEEEDSCEEDVVKVYRKEDFVINFFGTLNEFRHSSVLTDLILTTADGKSLHVHTAVIAAVSSHIRSSLSPRDVGNLTVGDCREGGVTRRSFSLGPEVNHTGIEAVVEFAYTGLISCLDIDSIHHIKKAAESLGAIRVLEVCTEVEERSENTQVQIKDVASAKEEMTKTLQVIKQLWDDCAGCDVTLEVMGGSFNGQ